MNFTSKIHNLSSIFIIILIVVFIFNLLSKRKQTKHEYILPVEIIKQYNTITEPKKNSFFKIFM